MTEPTVETADLADPHWVVFGGQPSPEPGMAADHALFDPVRKLFTRNVEDVRTDFVKVSDQVDKLVNALQKKAGAYALEEVTVELGFSASGRLVFVAEAGVTATISVTYRRAEA
jgi:hypothetical protein